MKRPSGRGSFVASQEQEDCAKYMEQQGLDIPGGAVAECDGVATGAYNDDDEEEDELACGRGGLGEKKRRLASDQVRALERCFEADNKLDPERKARIARDLHLHPRQVAVWFQNRRARWKTKQIERDFAALRARHDALRLECDELRRDKDALAAEIRELREKVEKQMSVKLESAAEDGRSLPASGGAPATAIYKQVDGSTDSDSSAVFNEDTSPYSAGPSLDHHHHPTFTGFTSFLASSSVLSSSFPSIYSGAPHLDQEAADGSFLGAADGFFAEEQGTGLGGWYSSDGW